VKSEDRLPRAVVALLIYHGLLLLASVFFIVTFGVFLVTQHEYGFVLYILALVCWGSAISYASVGMSRRRPGGFLVGMICHLLLAVVGLVGIFSLVVLPFLDGSKEAREWAPLFLLFALMWLPFVVISAWGFFYLRRLRQSMLS
jgi:hypothetical protein